MNQELGRRDAMYVCICRAVTEREIRDAVELGADSMHALRDQLGVAAECGKCEPEIRRILKETRRSHHHMGRRTT
jgi:bacterioferritin-associated ferredoxin